MCNPPDELQLRQLLVGLEYGPLGEQFSQDAPVAQKRQGEPAFTQRNRPVDWSPVVPAAPHVDGGRVPLLAQEQLWWAVP